jgi:undecaprenyl-diphosphatase
MIEINNSIFYLFYNLAHQSRVFDNLIIFIAEVLPYILVVTAFLFLFLHEDKSDTVSIVEIFKKRFKEIALVFGATLLAWVFSFALKQLFMLERPFIKFLDVSPLWAESGYAFPSSHSTFFMALAFSLYFSHKKVGYVFMFFALLIGISRIIAGVHFPVDIFGGFVLGGGIAYAIELFYKNR